MNMPEDTQVAVFEMGMSNFGEISKLSQITNPILVLLQILVLLTLKNLKSRYNIFLAKSGFRTECRKVEY
ncbi:hypothetical protein [Caldicellulosiruptor bescii]|uniref:hypothetical protein n=1 Tax=Caldicellulosiruptor bescii TaxID=31899 RepID=UPI00277B5631|nr:hypothetical protein [Caldicellulosiruptor bescii]